MCGVCGHSVTRARLGMYGKPVVPMSKAEMREKEKMRRKEMEMKRKKKKLMDSR